MNTRREKYGTHPVLYICGVFDGITSYMVGDAFAFAFAASTTTIIKAPHSIYIERRFSRRLVAERAAQERLFVNDVIYYYKAIFSFLLLISFAH